MGEAGRFRFGVFEADVAAGELRKQGIRVKVNVQPFQVLALLLARPGEVLTREEIAKELWPDGTFVDYEHGVNSAVNRVREALGDSAKNPRFVETLARRGYRFVASVERIGEVVEAPPVVPADFPRVMVGHQIFASEHELPKTHWRVVQVMYLALQGMYLGYYVGALANLSEIWDLFSGLRFGMELFVAVVLTATVLIPVRVFLLSAVLMRPPGVRRKLLVVWRFAMVFDLLWALAPFLLLNHIPVGLALGFTAPLVYAVFAQRSLVLMGAGRDG